MIFIDDWPRDRLLVTDYGGYLNLLNSAVTFGLAQSEEAVARSYRDAALAYLVVCGDRKTLGIEHLRFSIVVIQEIVGWWREASMLSQILRRKIRCSSFASHSASQFSIWQKVALQCL